MSIYDTYEVFIQRTHADSHVHVGSLLAANSELALQTARENFLRREQVLSMWVVPRTQVLTSAPDFLSREHDKSYREVAGYTENGRLWRLFKEKAITLEEIVELVQAERERKATHDNK